MISSPVVHPVSDPAIVGLGEWHKILWVYDEKKISRHKKTGVVVRVMSLLALSPTKSLSEIDEQSVGSVCRALQAVKLL
ncbi:hypothetical protein Plhal304r1_c003g0013081 [Plasmopara halstedii]